MTVRYFGCLSLETGSSLICDSQFKSRQLTVHTFLPATLARFPARKAWNLRPIRQSVQKWTLQRCEISWSLVTSCSSKHHEHEHEILCTDQCEFIKNVHVHQTSWYQVLTIHSSRRRVESDECSEPFQWILSPFDEFSLQDAAIAASSWAAKKHLHHMNTSCQRIQERDLVISGLFKPYFFWTVRMKHTNEFGKKKTELHLIRFKDNSVQGQDAQCNLAPKRPSEEIQKKIQRSSNRPVWDPRWSKGFQGKQQPRNPDKSDASQRSKAAVMAVMLTKSGNNLPTDGWMACGW